MCYGRTMTSLIAGITLFTGLMLLAWQFLCSCKKTQKLTGKATIGLLLFSIYSLLAIAMFLAFLLTLPFFENTSISSLFLASISLLLFGAFLATSSLIYYTLPLYHFFWGRALPMLFFGGFLCILPSIIVLKFFEFPKIFGITFSTHHLLWNGILFLFALVFIQLALFFHHFFSLSRNAEVKTKSLFLMFVNLGLLLIIFAHILTINFVSIQTEIISLAAGFLGTSLIFTILSPSLSPFLLKLWEIFPPSSQISNFLRAL